MGTAATIVSLPDPKEYEWWGFGPATFFHLDVRAYFKGQKRPSRYLNRWYEIHSIDGNSDYPAGIREGESLYWEWLKTLDCPVYMQQAHSEIKNSVEFPARELVNIFGRRFAGTSNWVTAHAIYENVTKQKISVFAPFGVDLVTDAEARAAERECQQFLMGWLCGQGITLEAFDCLLTERMYGYVEADF